MHTFNVAATPALFNVMELVPPPGSRIIVKNVEGSGATTTRFRLIVSSVTAITANLATGSVVLHNPPSLLAIARVGTRADVGAAGYLYAPAFRLAEQLVTVVDSIENQRLSIIYQVINEATEFAVKGYITASEYDTAARVIL